MGKLALITGNLLVALITLSVGASTLGAQSEPASASMLDSIAGAGVRANRAVGLVAAVVRGEDTLLMEAYGNANLEWEVPMTVDALFEVGSVAKQFTAAAILQLRDAGELSLADPITAWLPELGHGGEAVTLRHLLTHTSGIFRFDDTPEFEINYVAPRVARDSAYDVIRLEPFRFAPGEAQAYSNAGFWLLGLVVERVSGMRYEAYLQQEIFEPLEMTRSMYCDGRANIPRRAHGYQMLPTGTVRRAPQINYSWVFAPGALCTTASDLVTWLQALHGGEVLSPDSYAEMTSSATLEDGTPLQYGMGIKVGEDIRGLRYIGHGGTAPGFRADATWYPDAQLAVVVLMNTSPAPLAPSNVGVALARELLPAPRPTTTFYTDDPAPFVGTYEHVAGGNREGLRIEVTEGPIGLSFSRNGSRPRPLPWAGKLTFYASDHVTLTFRRADGDTGPVAELHGDQAGNHFILRKQ